MATVQLSIDMVDAGYVVGVVDQIWQRSLNRTVQPGTQLIQMSPGSYLDWSLVFDYWPAVPDPVVSGTVTIETPGPMITLEAIQSNYLTFWVSGTTSGTYLMNWWVERESGRQQSDNIWLSVFGVLPPPIQ